MEINNSIQLGLEQALAALVPYLQGLEDPDGNFDFLDELFPAVGQTGSVLFMAGHAAEDLPDDKTDFLAFVAALPQWRDARHRLAAVDVRFELGTGGIADKDTREDAIALHSQRAGAIIQLFSRSYLRTLLQLLNHGAARPWEGLIFTGWEPAKPDDGKSVSGNSFIAKPTYTFDCALS